MASVYTEKPVLRPGAGVMSSPATSTRKPLGTSTRTDAPVAERPGHEGREGGAHPDVARGARLAAGQVEGEPHACRLPEVDVVRGTGP